MAYRNGTYIAFHAGGTTDPTASDIRYYRILKAWHENDAIEFKFINSHDKTSAVRDASKKETLQRALRERLNNSCNMVLVIGPTTKLDTDWVPFEISHAVDVCKIPIIATYTGYSSVMNPVGLRSLWPAALATRIDNGSAKVIHLPFKRAFIDDAIGRFTVDNLPSSGLDYYTAATHKRWGVDV
jgi:hypothetical protein